MFYKTCLPAELPSLKWVLHTSHLPSGLPSLKSCFMDLLWYGYVVPGNVKILTQSLWRFTRRKKLGLCAGKVKELRCKSSDEKVIDFQFHSVDCSKFNTLIEGSFHSAARTVINNQKLPAISVSKSYCKPR